MYKENVLIFKVLSVIKRCYSQLNFRQLLIERRQEIEERTLASSERGLGLLYESEKVRGKLRKKGEIAFVFLLCN